MLKRCRSLTMTNQSIMSSSHLSLTISTMTKTTTITTSSMIIDLMMVNNSSKIMIIITKTVIIIKMMASMIRTNITIKTINSSKT